MPYIEHKYGKTFYTKKGSGKNTPIIMLHGGPGGTHSPQSPIFDLAKGRRVYSYTQVGSGKSSATSQKHWTVATFVDELAILIDAWGLTDFHLMGASWGTTLALEYYLCKKGKGVRSLAFLSPMFSAKDWHNDAKQLLKRMSPKHQKIIRYCHEIGATGTEVYQGVMKAYYAKHVCRNPKILAEMFARINPNGGDVYRFMWGESEFEPTGTLKTYDQVAALKKIAAPTIIMCGEHDEATPTTAKKYVKKIPNAEFSEIRGAAHAFLKEKPKPTLKVLDKFIGSVEA